MAVDIAVGDGELGRQWRTYLVLEPQWPQPEWEGVYFALHSVDMTARMATLARRPAGLASNAGPRHLRPQEPLVGECWFDVDAGLPSWWNGSAWVTAVGAVLY